MPPKAKQATKLSVNVDHVATVRQARKAGLPDPVEAAKLAEKAGASGVTVHLRRDRRHIQDDDVARLKKAVKGKLNVELAMAQEMVDLAVKLKPHQVTLVPERPEEVTTEGGISLLLYTRRVGDIAEQLQGAGIAVSLFIDPDPEQIEAVGRLRERGLSGVEINTDAYTKAKDKAASDRELAKIAKIANQAKAAGLAVYAGHGLTEANVGPIAKLAAVEELNIGHAIVARAVIVGFEAAVKEMLAAMGG
jgi:pyridoxine 5-phosphate synthase